MSGRALEAQLLAAPIGFVKSCATLAKLPNGLTVAMQDALERYCSGNNGHDIPENELISPGEGVLKKDVIKALLYLIKMKVDAVPALTNQEYARILDNNTVLSRDNIAEMISSIEAFETNRSNTLSNLANASPNNDLNFINGQLINFKWKFGISLCSDSCKSIQTPYIAFSFAVKDLNGQVKHHDAELTYNEFQSLYKSFKNIQLSIDSL